jgi:hypothetical protein
MNNRPWIKLHTQWLDETRLLRLHERTQLRYFQLYMLAGRLNADGSFIENGHQLDERDIALKLRVKDFRLFQSDIKALKSKEAELIGANGHGLFVKAFKDEQVDWNKKQESDRERQARHRESVTRDNDVTNKHVTRKSRPQKEIQSQTEIKKEKEIKTTTTKASSSNSRRSSLVGGGGNLASIFQNLSSKEKQTIKIMRPILIASGLSNPALNKLLIEVAIRIKPSEAKSTTLAALASVYADKSVMNKPIVAARRIQDRMIPAEFFKPETWGDIPDEVFIAAGEVKTKKIKDAFAEFINQEE